MASGLIYHNEGVCNSQKSRSHLKILGARKITWITFQTEDKQVSNATVQNLVTTVIWCLGFVHQYHNGQNFLSSKNVKPIILCAINALTRWCKEVFINCMGILLTQTCYFCSSHFCLIKPLQSNKDTSFHILICSPPNLWLENFLVWYF
jgi:hypothetical protein